ncbi:MAG: lamin tail domain-containing protein [Verrucomicrobia bacterium]|nr:lamin tail domain-containing protein [Verrucomicrobiota bacterium]
MRFLKTADTGTDLYLGLDDITVIESQALIARNLRTTPPLPTGTDAINILVDLDTGPFVSNLTVSAHYRLGTAGTFLSAPMSLTTGQTYAISSSIPPTGGGDFQYYVEVTYASLTPFTLYAPAGGAAEPATIHMDSPLAHIYDRQLFPSSRMTPISISEIMYHPLATTNGASLEYIEIFNTEFVPHDLGGFRLSGDISFTFPSNTTILPRGFLLIAKDPYFIQTQTQISGILGPYSGTLPNGGGILRLRNRRGAVLLEVNYADDPPWPVAADGYGHSLVQRAPDYGENSVHAWAASAERGGSIRNLDTPATSPRSLVVINEVLAHTDLPDIDFVELFNPGTSAVDLGGCQITDNQATNIYTFSPGTMLLPRAYLVRTQTELGFSFSSHGDDVVLIDPAENRVIDVVRFGATQNGVSQGRTPDGSPGRLQALQDKSPGSTNGAARVHQIVINEIMYHPITEDPNDEYIELHNAGTNAVDLSAWRLVDGVDFIIPNGTLLAPGGYLVIAENAARLIARYPQLNAANTLGNFSGSLSDRGERIALAKPDDALLPNQDFVLVDEVTYLDGDHWGRWADGGGSSLELCDPRSDNRMPTSWAGSDETGKAPWTLIEHTGNLDNGRVYNPDELQLLSLGAGECLIDKIEIIKNGSPLSFNGDFESGLTGWVIQGNHSDSYLETTEGYASARSLHLVSESDGDIGANRAEIDITGLTSTDTGITIRARARWLAGHRDVLLRLLGNWLELSGTLDLPPDLGTPGLVNSCWVSNAAPAIIDVQHLPVLPAASQAVQITARVEDVDGVAAVTLHYRVDPSATDITIAMNDNGTGADVRAHDGIYSAALPGQTANKVVAFYVEASDAHAAPSSGTYPQTAPSREALVMFGQTLPAGGFGTYRFWITDATRTLWNAQVRLSNKLMDTTLVYNDFRAIYDAAIRYRGSSFIRQAGDPITLTSAYAFKTPKHDPLLGTRSFNLDGLEFGRDTTYQGERMCYWIADQINLPFNYERYVHIYVSNVKKGNIYADVSFPNADWVGTWFPEDRDGSLYEIDDWFEYDDGLGHSHLDATLGKYLTTGGQYKRARYRWNWEKKTRFATDDSYRDIFTLADAMNLPLGDLYDTRVSALVDFENWMRIFAVRHSVGDWDGYGYQRGKNTYTYNPNASGWKMLLWDLDFSLGAGSHGPSTGMFSSIGDPVLSTKFFVHPRFRRAYYRAMHSLAYGPYQPDTRNAVLDAQYVAFITNGVSVTAPTATKSWMDTRLTSLLSELGTVNSAFDIVQASITSNETPVYVSGHAPVQIKTLLFNGVPHWVNWINVTTWETHVSVTSSVSSITVEGIDLQGNLVDSAGLTITYTGPLPAPAPTNELVINEIHYNPLEPNAEFIEIHNRSANHRYDLDGFRIEGVDMDFGPQSLIGPGEYGVLAENVAQFANVYTNVEVVMGSYAGDLDDQGEMVRLLSPAGSNTWRLLDQVRYDNNAPWPVMAAGSGPSLQLQDGAQDNRRAGNWAAVTNTLPIYTPGASNSVPYDFPALPPLWINEILPQNTATLQDNAGEYDPWVEIYNDGNSPVDLTQCVLSDQLGVPGMWSFPTGTVIAAKGYLLVWCDATPAQTTPTNLHASFRLTSPTGVVALAYVHQGRYFNLDAIAYNFDGADVSFGPTQAGDPYVLQLFPTPTPAASNVANAVSVIIRVNEWMADNQTTLVDDSDSTYDDWFELYNLGTQSVDLTGFFLSDNLSNPGKFQIPPGVVIPAGGYLLIWADGDDDINAPGTNLHVNFSLSRSGESISLYAPNLSVVDQVQFGAQTTDVSEGRLPNGSGTIRTLPSATPGYANVDNAPAPVINAATQNPTGHFSVSWNGDIGQQYRFEASQNLMLTNWVVLGTTTATSGVVTVTDTNMVFYSLRYYRLVLQP